MPSKLMTFSDVLDAIRDEYDERNKVGITYEGEPDLAPTLEELQDLQHDLEEETD